MKYYIAIINITLFFAFILKIYYIYLSLRKPILLNYYTLEQQCCTRYLFVSSTIGLSRDNISYMMLECQMFCEFILWYIGNILRESISVKFFIIKHNQTINRIKPNAKMKEHLESRARTIMNSLLSYFYRQNYFGTQRINLGHILWNFISVVLFPWKLT